MAKCQEVVDFHQLDCKKPTIKASQPFALEAKVRRPLGFQNAYMIAHYDQGDGSLKGSLGWTTQHKPKLWSRGSQFLFIIKFSSKNRQDLGH
jgi:hypothetical protein